MRTSLLFLILFAVGCNTPAKKLAKADALIRANPSVLARACSDLFPVPEQTTRIDTVTVTDTLTDIRTDTLRGIERDTVRLTLTKYKDRLVTNTITKEIRVKDAAREKQLLDQVAVANTNVAKADERAAKAEGRVSDLKEGRNIWRLIAIGLMVLILGTGVLRILGKLKPI